jgi:hypothetical protein
LVILRSSARNRQTLAVLTIGNDCSDWRQVVGNQLADNQLPDNKVRLERFSWDGSWVL